MSGRPDDFSNLPSEHPLYSNINERKIGALKVEIGGKIIKSFYVSTAKCYKVNFLSGSSISKCKCVPKRVSERYTARMYRDSALVSSVCQYSTFRRIGITRNERETALIDV